MGKILVIIILILGIAGGAFVLTTQESKTNSQAVSNIVAPTPTPMPFIEMTIPYLRQRTWQSSLSDLRSYSQNGNFNTYLTSYDSDGLRVNGLLTIPSGPVPRSPSGDTGWPAIVFVHGYIAPSIYETTERYQDYVNYLARNGFVVFKIDLRGHGDSEGEAGGGYYSSDYVIDTLNAYAALESSDFVNEKQIGLWGHSMAGNVLLRSFAVKPDIPAVVIWAGAGYTYSDLQQFGIDDNSYRPPTDNSERQRRREALRAAHGDFNKESEFWKQVAPTNYLNDLKGAIALYHAVDDTVVSVEYSRNLNSLLDQTSVANEFFEYPSGGHDIEGASFGQAMQRTVEFYKKYL